MKLSVLASSSSGNSIYIEHNNFKCLVDAGLTGKKVVENLAQIGRDIKDINAIFVTHEHIDHIKGVGVLARKYNIPVYANALTWKNMSKCGEINSDLKFNFEKEESKISFFVMTAQYPKNAPTLRLPLSPIKTSAG